MRGRWWSWWVLHARGGMCGGGGRYWKGDTARYIQDRVLWLNGRASDYESVASGGCRFDPCQDHIFARGRCDMTRSVGWARTRRWRYGRALWSLGRSSDPMWRSLIGRLGPGERSRIPAKLPPHNNAAHYALMVWEVLFFDISRLHARYMKRQ